MGAGDDRASAAGLRLGMRVIDTATGIDGVLLAITHWFDRSDEAAIQRLGVDAEGAPRPIHWIPISRARPNGDQS